MLDEPLYFAVDDPEESYKKIVDIGLTMNDAGYPGEEIMPAEIDAATYTLEGQDFQAAVENRGHESAIKQVQHEAAPKHGYAQIPRHYERWDRALDALESRKSYVLVGGTHPSDEHKPTADWPVQITGTVTSDHDHRDFLRRLDNFLSMIALDTNVKYRGWDIQGGKMPVRDTPGDAVKDLTTTPIGLYALVDIPETDQHLTIGYHSDLDDRPGCGYTVWDMADGIVTEKGFADTTRDVVHLIDPILASN